MNHFVSLPIALGDTLQLILLLDGVGVAGSLGGVDQLFSKALGDALDVSERGLTGTDGEEGNGLVDTTEGRHIDGLSSHGTGASNSGAVFTRTAVDNGINSDLDGVLVGHDVDLTVTMLDSRSLLLPGAQVERTISKECATIRIAINFLPLLRPFIMSELVNRSMIGH